MYIKWLWLLTAVTITSGQPKKCDQTPPQATVLTPSEDKELFFLKIANAKVADNGMLLYTPAQTYVLTIETMNITRPFRWFMITAEDPAVDNNIYTFGRESVDVGSLKTLDEDQSRYSEKCANSVENYDNSWKLRVEIHWVSPKETEQVRIRAMVAENSEKWYTGDNLIITLALDTASPLDSPPYKPNITCNLCSEARYEVIFKGQWSRLTHPRHYPSKPDENGYSHMVGASHDYNFTLWASDAVASPGLSTLAKDADISLLEREIINSMSETGGTRTLIRGRRRHHPHMHEPSYALFRTDRIHHLFSVAVGMKPSPDWFLGTQKFELCTDTGWLEYYDIPMYPWDAGIVDGVSYESPVSMTQPVNSIKRVEVGSFDPQSPFYQMNLNDLQPFARLEIRRLDVYQWAPSECSDKDHDQGEEEASQDEPQESPRIAESRQYLDGCNLGEWGEWSPCMPDVGDCGIGAQTRTRQISSQYAPNNEHTFQNQSPYGSCQADADSIPMEMRHCIVEC